MSFAATSPMGNFLVTKDDRGQWCLLLNRVIAVDETGEQKRWTSALNAINDVHCHLTGFKDWDELSGIVLPNSLKDWAEFTPKTRA